jgi:hypothetical protein
MIFSLVPFSSLNDSRRQADKDFLSPQRHEGTKIGAGKDFEQEETEVTEKINRFVSVLLCSLCYLLFNVFAFLVPLCLRGENPVSGFVVIRGR